MRHYQTALVDTALNPVRAVERLAESDVLGRYVVYERSGCWYVAAHPLLEVVVDERWVRSTVNGPHSAQSWNESWSGNPWRQLSAALARTPVATWRVYGWACFELAMHIVTSAKGTRQPSGGVQLGPLAHLMVPGLEIELTGGRALVRSLNPELLDVVTDALAAPEQREDPQPCPVAVRVDGAVYQHNVAHAISDITRGRLHKVILSRVVPVGFPVDICATYALGRPHNTPARSFLLDLGGWRAAGFSPESLIEVSPSGEVSTQPLAGTRARSADPSADAALREELQSDPKEIFEHVVSVKLAFEEIAQVAVAGSVRISEFLTVKSRGSVHHLGSRVVGTLCAHHTAWDALGVVFPAVTASGIPKSPALDVIGELEDTARGLYAGAVIMADAEGGLDAALVLRAIYQRGGQTWLRAGAGVVRTSVPEREYEETCEKLGSVAPYVVRAR